MSLDRRTLLKASALGAGGLVVSTALPGGLLPAALADPPSPNFGPGIEGYARYEGQTQCIGSEQPGVAAFKRMILSSYPGSRNLGIIRACGIGGTSEHKEGRAWDWGVYATRANEASWAQQVINWLLATDGHGNRHANARRLGLMYMIWNRRIWKAYSNPETWHTYTGSNPHTDHIHFSFGWPGAKKTTSFWGTAAPQSRAKWSDWTATASGIASAPAATSWSSSRTDVFAVGSHGTLLHRWMVAGRGWNPGSTWEDLGAPPGRRFTSAPTTVSRSEGTLDVFVRASDGALWRRSYSPSTRWTPWSSIGGACTSDPSAVSSGPDHVMVVVRGADNALWQRSWEGRWLRWRRLTGPVTSGPAIVSWGPGRYDMFARGSGLDLIHKVWQGGSWSGWMSRGGVLGDNATIAAASMYSGRLEVIVLGDNRHVYIKRFSGGEWTPSTSGWAPFGAPGGGVLGGVSATSLHSRHLELFVRGADGHLHQRWYA